MERYRYYLRLLGQTPDNNLVPDTLNLDRQPLTEANFADAYTKLIGQYEKAIPLPPYSQLRLARESSPVNQSGASGPGRLYLNRNEDVELNDHLPKARDTRLASNVNDTIASQVAQLPELDLDLHFWGLGLHSKIFGGMVLAEMSKIDAQILRTISAWEQDQGSIASRTASYERRADEWMFQSNLAARELMQIGRQIIGSLIAEQVAHHEYLNTKKLIENSQEMDRFLREKFTNQELYAWMQGEISRLYYEYYRFAFDTARKAEQTMKRELMRPEVGATDYIKFNYWDGGRKGLLSGEALYLDLKRMELAYHEYNKREYELTKYVSLRQLDPFALLTLKATGSCQVTIPEWLYDMDCPGHYMRRIKTVGITVPCIAGPYTSINCTLTLTKSSLRTSPLIGDGYRRTGSEDTRFVDYFSATQSIVTSSGQNDSGLFETNLRDERTLPFEGAGAESTWRFDLPRDFRSFDYNTITDVILHVRYTAREGGGQLRDGAVENIGSLVGDVISSDLALLLSLPHDFPSEWHQFTSGSANFTTMVKREYFPYFTQGKGITINAIKLYTVNDEKLSAETPAGLDYAACSGKLNDAGAFDFSLPESAVLTRKPQANVFILIQYSVG